MGTQIYTDSTLNGIYIQICHWVTFLNLCNL